MSFFSILLCLGVYICAKGCEIGWIRLHTKCYMFSHTTASWAEAESICSAFHSILAEPKSTEESKFLISHSENEGRLSSQPNEHTSANCVILWKAFHGLWADEPCGKHYNFICETLHQPDGDVIG
ncbi:asialoglycoprotein receptor 2-like isoform X2 [Crassostrea virginica]